jgi:hypothetical protein
MVYVSLCWLGIGLAAVGAANIARASDEQDDGLSVVVEGTLDADLRLVRATLLDLDAFKEWFPAIGEWRILQRDAASALVYGSQALPWPVSDRDYVVRYRWWGAGDSEFHLEATALADAPPPPPEDRVRIEVMTTLWTLRADGDRTIVQYTYEGSSGMPLPDWVAKIGWRSRTGALIEALAAEVTRRRAAAVTPPPPSP